MGLWSWGLYVLGGPGVGERDGECAAFAETGINAHRPAMRLHDALDYAKPQAGSLDPPPGLVHPVKPLKDLVEFLLGDAYSLVGNVDQELICNHL